MKFVIIAILVLCIFAALVAAIKLMSAAIGLILVVFCMGMLLSALIKGQKAGRWFRNGPTIPKTQ